MAPAEIPHSHRVRVYPNIRFFLFKRLVNGGRRYESPPLCPTKKLCFGAGENIITFDGIVYRLHGLISRKQAVRYLDVVGIQRKMKYLSRG